MRERRINLGNAERSKKLWVIGNIGNDKGVSCDTRRERRQSRYHT